MNPLPPSDTRPARRVAIDTLPAIITVYHFTGQANAASLITETSSTLSVVVPVYNSEESLPLLVERLLRVLPELAPHYELLLVNDASKDASWTTIQRLSQANLWIRGINLMRNYGQHNALLCGIRAARYDVIVTIDDDLQHPPEEIPKLLDKLAEGSDVVYGIPLNEQHGLWRDLASQVSKLVLQGAMGVSIASNISAFRVFRTQLRDAFANYQSSYVSIDVLLTWGTTRFAAIPLRHEKRQFGESNYTFRKLVRHTLNMVIGFSVLPLRFASLVGFAFTGFSLLVLVFVLGRYVLQGESVPGFPFLASIIGIFSGVQLFALGVMGEYIAHIHARSMERPAYTIREQTGSHTG